MINDKFQKILKLGQRQKPTQKIILNTKGEDLR